MKKKLLALALALGLTLALAACGSSGEAPPEEDTQTADTHVIVDHNDNQVEVPYEVERIAVCNILPLPSVISVFFDSADKIVGMPATSMTAAANGLLGELYPEILEAETGYIDGSTVNIEELIKLSPDVVLYNASDKEQGEQLRAAGLAAVAVAVNKWDYDAIVTLNHWIELLGEIFPENDKTAIVTQYSNDMYQLVQERVGDLPQEERQRALFLFQYSDTNLLTSGKLFFGQWWADAIGAVNVAEELTTDNSVAVNMEQIYAWDPSLIFITNFTTAWPDDLYNNTVGNYNWSPIQAIKDQNVHKMPLGMYRSYTPGVDTPVTLVWMAKTAYPHLFEDIDVTELTKDYYHEVFGITLTDEQAESIFTPSVDASKGFGG